MILPSSDIRVFDNSLASNNSFFTGGLNLQKLEFDPLITGYAFIIWTKIPFWMNSKYPGFKAMTQKNFKSLDGIGDMELQTSAYLYGFSNNEYHVNAGITKQNTEFTLKHQEYSGNPIKNMYQYWVSGIADPETGIASYPVMYGVDYAAKNHTGCLMYIVTRPDANNVKMKNIEFAAYWTNVIPTKIPLGHLNYTQGTHDLVEIDMPMKGTMHIGPKVDTYAKELLSNGAYTFVTEDMFDPTNNGEYTGQTIADYKPDEGISGSGLGDQIKTNESSASTQL